jgi:cytochrome c biogenesis protein
MGSVFGLQAFVFLPEGRGTSSVFLRNTEEPFPLGFELRCDRFEKTFYPNGMVKQYRADLSVVNPDSEKSFQKSVIINDPLTHQGFSFYVGDAYPLDDFFILARNRTTGQEQAFRIPARREVTWQGTNVSFIIEELKNDEDGAVSQSKIRFSADANVEPSVVWIKDKGSVNFRQSGEEFTLSFRQHYSTLLLVTKDPGVIIVYSGFLLMITGLAISFFLSHRRLWALVVPQGEHSAQVLLSGSSNKHKPAFEKRFENLVTAVRQNTTLSAGSPKKRNQSKSKA